MKIPSRLRLGREAISQMTRQASACIVPPRPIPVSTSQWIGARMPAVHGPLLKLPGKPEIGDRGDQGVFDDLVDLGIGGGGEDDDGGRDPAHPELHPLVGVCHAEAGGAVCEGGVGDLDRPVAVGVRLDHLHDPHAGADQPFHLRPVRGEVAEVDFDPASVFKIFLQ